jgi:hypothetical protein
LDILVLLAQISVQENRVARESLETATEPSTSCESGKIERSEGFDAKQIKIIGVNIFYPKQADKKAPDYFFIDGVTWTERKK